MTEKFGNKIKFLKIIYMAKSLIKSEVFFFYVKKSNAKSDLKNPLYRGGFYEIYE